MNKIAFEKISLEAGERCEVCFEITEPMLRFWNMENQFISEPGVFSLSVGYADHLRLTRDFRLL